MGNDTSAGATANEQRTWMGELSGSISPVVMAAVYVIGAVKEIRAGGGREHEFLYSQTHTSALPLAFEGQRHAWCHNLFSKPEKRIGTSMQETHTNFFLFPKCWREPREDEIIRHLP